MKGRGAALAVLCCAVAWAAVAGAWGQPQAVGAVGVRVLGCDGTIPPDANSWRVGIKQKLVVGQ